MESILEAISAGQITWATAIVGAIAALVLGAIGGAIGGVIVGGKHMGNELAAMMGAFYGPIAAVPGVVVALIALCIFQ